MSKRRNQYDRNFKVKAVELIPQRSSVVDLAKELGVEPNLIYRWRRELSARSEASFPGNGKEGLTDQEAEIKRLKRELADAQEERDILKKAVGIFSKRNGKSFSS
jgi:transposase